MNMTTVVGKNVSIAGQVLMEAVQEVLIKCIAMVTPENVDIVVQVVQEAVQEVHTRGTKNKFF